MKMVVQILNCKQMSSLTTEKLYVNLIFWLELSLLKNSIYN